MLPIVSSMLLIIIVAAAVLVFAAFTDRGVEPSRGRWFVRAVGWIAARLDGLLHVLARVAARVRPRRREASHRRST